MFDRVGRLFFAPFFLLSFVSHLIPFCIHLVYFLKPLDSFLVNILLFIDIKIKLCFCKTVVHFRSSLSEFPIWSAILSMPLSIPLTTPFSSYSMTSYHPCDQG